jgi:hypothetical protein
VEAAFCATARPPTTQRHGRITPEPIRIVHVLVSSEPPEHRLPDLTGQGMAAILARPGISETLPGKLCQAKGIIKLAKGEQTGIGRDLGAANSSLTRRSNVRP